MSKITIIGKGFVGKNLLNQYSEFKHQVYDSKNISLINQQEHDIILCAAPSGKKWLVNQDKQKDLDNIMSLVDILKKTKFKKLILFSTIDIYNNNCVIENEQSINFNIEPYGNNRRIFENEIMQMTDCTHVIRLPALFGNYLEKNYIYDLLNSNMIDKIKMNSSFQWYPISKLREHIEFLIENNIPVLNLSVQPIDTGTIVDTFFPELKNQLNFDTKGIFYDMRSGYINDYYFLNKNIILIEMEKYIRNVRNNN